MEEHNAVMLEKQMEEEHTVAELHKTNEYSTKSRVSNNLPPF